MMRKMIHSLKLRSSFKFLVCIVVSFSYLMICITDVNRMKNLGKIYYSCPQYLKELISAPCNHLQFLHKFTFTAASAGNGPFWQHNIQKIGVSHISNLPSLCQFDVSGWVALAFWRRDLTHEVLVFVKIFFNFMKKIA